MSDPVTEVSRNLGLILRLCNDIEAQAVAKATDRDMPGGAALVEVSPVANLEAWAAKQDAAETAYYAAVESGREATWPDTSHENDTEAPVLQTLLFWTEDLRRIHDEEWEGHRPTLASEAHYLRNRLDWLLANEPHFADMANDVHDARVSLENLLRAGERAERGVPCMYAECQGTLLTRKLVPYGNDDGAKRWRHTDWHCPSCKRSYDDQRYRLNVTAAYEQTAVEVIDGETWCSVTYAHDQTGRSAKTIRTWINRGELETACIVAGRRRPFVRLAQVQERHDESTSRRTA